MMNLEVSGMIGSVEVKADLKNKGVPVLKIALMDEKGKPFNATVVKINDTVHGLQRGQEVVLRFEDVDFAMIDFGKWMIKSESVKIMGQRSSSAPGPVSAPTKAAA